MNPFAGEFLWRFFPLRCKFSIECQYFNFNYPTNKNIAWIFQIWQYFAQNLAENIKFCYLAKKVEKKIEFLKTQSKLSCINEMWKVYGSKQAYNHANGILHRNPSKHPYITSIKYKIYIPKKYVEIHMNENIQQYNQQTNIIFTKQLVCMLWRAVAHILELFKSIMSTNTRNFTKWKVWLGSHHNTSLSAFSCNWLYPSLDIQLVKQTAQLGMWCFSSNGKMTCLSTCQFSKVVKDSCPCFSILSDFPFQ